MAAGGKNVMELVIAARDRTAGAFTKIKSRVGGLEGTAKKVSTAFKAAATGAALIGGAAVIAGIAGSTKAFMDFEDAMANVRKTTGMTKAQIDVMGGALNRLALEIPVAQTELADIAAVAGQLGITGQKSILDFTATVAKMSTAFDMPAEAAAIAMAKMANIYDIPIEKVSALGSAINALGNTTAAQESAIMDFAMSLGASAKMLGFNETESVAMGASLISMGMDASAAGTRLNSAFTQMGKNVTEISAFLDMTEADFKTAFGEDPMNMLIRVTEKLSLIKDPLERNTVAAETFGLIGAKAINNLGANIDGLKTNLKTAGEEFKKDTSLTEEFAAKTDTLKARFQLLKNSISGLLIEVGGELAPTLNTVIGGLRNIIPPLKEVVFEIGSGFKEMFESIARQAGPALDPLIAKIKETGDKMSSGLSFKTLADDIGVFIGAGLNPLIRGFTWLIDKFGPLWGLLEKGVSIFHNLANALKTEEGRLDDIIDATEGVTNAKQDLFDVNERLRGNMETLSTALDKAGGWTTTLSDLEADAKTKTDALSEARKAASEAISVHGANSEIAKAAIENVKVAEEAATAATTSFNTAVSTATTAIIDEGVATEGLQKAQLDFVATTEEATTKQGELRTAVSELEVELEEAKAAPFDLGIAFTEFGNRVGGVFLEIPLKIAESILKVQETIAGGLEKIGLGGFTDKFEGSMEVLRAKIATIRESLETNIEDPLSEDIPRASDEMEEAVTEAAEATVSATTRTKEGIEEVDNALEDAGVTAIDTGEAGEDAFEKVEVTIDEVSDKVTVLTDDLGASTDQFKDNEEAAKALLELDWAIFSELEMNLPNINEGIGNMTTAFEGLEIVLEENLENLESVRESVDNISALTSPFTDGGFANGIKSIGTFATALSDAGSAIDTFSSLQEVSIDGMLNFSLHVKDMVSALEILEGQMENLVPSFEEMDSLIGDIANSFLYSGEKGEEFVSDFSEAMKESGALADKGSIAFTDFKEIVDNSLDLGTFKYLYQDMDQYTTWWKTSTVNSVYDVTTAFVSARKAAKAIGSELGSHHMEEFFTGSATDIRNWAKNIYGVEVSIEEINGIMEESTKVQAEWLRTSILSHEELDTSLHKGVKNLKNWAEETYGVAVSFNEAYNVMAMSEKEQLEWLDKLMHSNTALNFQMDKQTDALAAQTGQLNKITDALQPYLDFMRTLNELAALSTLSTEELNSGLNAINDTLANLATSFSTFDLRPVMEALFGTIMEAEGKVDEYSGGAASSFTDTMKAYESPLHNLIVYITRLSGAITGLTSAFDSLANISDSVLADQTKLEEVFEGITDVMSNFSKEMGGTEGFADMFADGMDAMIKTADPLTAYFRSNNAAIELFNNTLNIFSATITNVVDTMGMLKDMSEMVLPSVDELEAGFERAEEAVLRFQEAMLSHIGLDTTTGMFDEEKFKNNVFTGITNFATDWNNATKGMNDDFKTLDDAITTITNMISGITSLTEAFKVLAEMPLITSDQVVVCFGKIRDTINEVDKGMRAFAAEGLNDLVSYLKSVANMWTEWDEKLGDSTTTFSDAVDDIGALVGAIASLITVQGQLAEIDIVDTTEWESFFSDLTKHVHTFYEGMAKFGEKGIADLASNLKGIEEVWQLWTKEMEDSLISFNETSSTITGILNNVLTLSAAFTTLGRATMATAADMERSMRNVDVFIGRFTTVMASNLGSIVGDLETLEIEWGKYSEDMEKLMPSFEDATSDISTLLGTVSSLNAAFKALGETSITTSATFDKGFSALIGSVGNFTTSLSSSIEPLIVSLQELQRVWVENEDVLFPLMSDFGVITYNLKGMANAATAMCDSFSDLHTGGILLDRGFDQLINVIKTTEKAIEQFYSLEAAAEISEFLTDIGLVIDSFRDLNEKLKGVLSEVEAKIQTSVGNIGMNIKSLANLNSTMFYSGQNLIGSLINGMNSMQASLAIASKGLADTIEDYLGVASPTKKGPLMDIEMWPRNLVRSFTEGIRNEMGALNGSFGEMLTPTVIGGNGGGGNRTNVTFHVTQNIKDRATADYTTRELERMIQKHVV